MDGEESRRSREETTLQIRKQKKDARLAKRRQLPTGGLTAAPTPAGMAAAGMLMNAGDSTYASMMEDANNVVADSSESQPNMTASKLEQLPAMVAGVMGNDPVMQVDATTKFRRMLSIEKNPPIQQVIDAGVVPRFVEFLQRDDNPALQYVLLKLFVFCVVQAFLHDRKSTIFSRQIYSIADLNRRGP